MVADDLQRRLLDELRHTTGRPGLAYAGPPEALRGGFWAELFAFSLCRGPEDWPRDLVGRVMPDAALGHKEAVVQRAVAAAGYPTPIVRAWGDASSGLGRAYIVMDRAPGAPLLGDLEAGITAFLRVPSIARRVPDQLARSMAELHALDPTPVREQLAGACGTVADLNGLVAASRHGAQECGRADIEKAAMRLADRVCTLEAEVICHGDLHPFNLLVDDAGTVTVLDWTAALLAPRTYDVAFTSLLLAEPPVVLPSVLRAPAKMVGRRLAARFVASYERAASIRIESHTLELLQAVVCLRALVEVAFWVAGGEVEERAGHPWLTNSAVFATRLSRATGTAVRAQ